MTTPDAPPTAPCREAGTPGLVLRVVGPTGSGKTTLVERLVAALTRSGLRVATLKSARHHRAPEDRPGSDTARLLDAGSVACAGRFADDIVIRIPAGDGLATTLRWLAAAADVVLVEGAHDLDLPAIELVAAGGSRSVRGSERIACVTAQPPGPGEFHRDDIGALASLVLERFRARER